MENMNNTRTPVEYIDVGSLLEACQRMKDIPACDDLLIVVDDHLYDAIVHTGSKASQADAMKSTGATKSPVEMVSLYSIITLSFTRITIGEENTAWTIISKVDFKEFPARKAKRIMAFRMA